MSTDHRDHQTGTTGSDSPLTSVPGRPAHAHFENRYSAQIEMVWTGGGPVDVPVVPNGYELRQFRSDDEAAYNELFHLAFADQNTLIQTRETALEQGLFVVEHIGSGHLVATCAAQHIENDRHPDGTQLGWLVGDPAHAGKRLGTIVSAMVTNRLATAEYALPYLQTNDFRFEAIAIYLKLGWRPYLFADDMEPRWRDVYAGMGLTYTSDDGVVA
ncbi:MAG: hypothetical protein HOL45_11030 [Chloroflexi bacterium]|nr:hypothetical protein [Chloroflexota bacterium]